MYVHVHQLQILSTHHLLLHFSPIFIVSLFQYIVKRYTSFLTNISESKKTKNYSLSTHKVSIEGVDDYPLLKIRKSFNLATFPAIHLLNCLIILCVAWINSTHMHFASTNTVLFLSQSTLINADKSRQII